MYECIICFDVIILRVALSVKNSYVGKNSLGIDAKYLPRRGRNKTRKNQE